MFKLISFIFLSLTFVNCLATPEWTSELRDRNIELSKKIDWNRLNELDQRKRSIQIAVVGSGIHIKDFKKFISINTNEIPNNGIDDDNNGYEDDYYGFNLVTGSGSNLNDFHNKHETHVSSAIAMLINNKAQKLRPITIIPIKINHDEHFYDANYMKKVADSIDYAIKRGANVINMSLGISKWNTLPFMFIDKSKKKSLAYIQAAINRAYDAGIVIVSSSSNDNSRNQTKEPDIPSDMKHVFSVTSVDFNHVIRKAYGRIIMTAFYGEDILLYSGDGKYDRLTGTSFAGPMVAAGIAMLMAKVPAISIKSIKKKVKDASIHKIYGNKKIRNGVFDLIKFLD